jgi:hypothetical protein
MTDSMDSTLDPDRAYIETPCEVSRELLGRHEAGWLCQSCDRHVIDLSVLTRAEAGVFLHETADQDLCIGYREDDQGRIEFASRRRLLPASRLLRGVQGGALALALSACTGKADAPKPKPKPTPTQTEAPAAKPTAAKPADNSVPTAGPAKDARPYKVGKRIMKEDD